MNSKTKGFECPFCGTTRNKRLVRCEKCNKLSHLILLMTGPALSMKSVIAYYLHRCLKIGLIESAYLGPALNADGITDDLLRKKRRSRLSKIVDIYLQDKLPVIVDAAFHRAKDRISFIELLEQNYPEICIFMVCCISKNKLRREYRRVDRAAKEESFEIDPLSRIEARRLLQEYDEPFNEKFPVSGKKLPIIFVDTDNYKVELRNVSSNSEHRILKEMKNIEQKLDRAFAVGQL